MRIILSILVVLTIFFTAACVKKEPIILRAQLLYAPLSPNATSVNFALGSNIFATQVNYSSTAGTIRYTFPYYSVEPTTANVNYNVQTTNLPLASANGITLEDEKAYSSFLIDSANKAKVVVVNDNLDEPAILGNFKIRFFNFSPNAPAVSVYIVGGSTTPVWTNRSFETQATATANEAFIELPAGTYTFELRNTVTSAVVATISSSAYLPDRIYTIAARGFVGGAGAQAIAGWIYPNKP